MENNKINFKRKISSIIYHHYNNCPKYKKILDFINFDFSKKIRLREFPYLPVNLFKEEDLLSIPKNKIFKVLNSSGTSGNKLSKIYLDKENSYNQVKALNNIMREILGKKRLPMLIIDNFTDNLDRSNFNAKIAAINGFSIFGKNHTYLLNNNRQIDYKILNNFLTKYGDEPFLIFGFTFKIYENLIKNLSLKKSLRDFSKGIIVHGGGWKKLNNLKIDNNKFKIFLKDKLNVKKVFNYYGLIEQTGSIFLECLNCNSFRTNQYTEVLIRDKNLNILPEGKKGFVQLFSLLPKSYPGNIILTEDIGEIVKKNNNCKFCKNETNFLIHGRFPKSIIRGCSDI